MQQGTDEWLEFRLGKIGASDAPIIMGVSPWNTITDLWEIKVRLKESNQHLPHMKKGLMMESDARQYFYLLTGYEVKPAIHVSKTHEWMMASLDGISEDQKIIVEIKCPGKKDHCLAEQGVVPEKYYPQLQHQLAVLNLNNVYYLSFDGQSGYLLKVERNQDYIDQLIKKEFEFYQCVKNFTPPQPFSTINDPRWESTALQLRSLQKKQKELELQETMLRNTLIGLSNGQNAQGNGVKLTKYLRKGNVDYKSICEDFNVLFSEEDYRKEDKEAWKITFVD